MLKKKQSRLAVKPIIGALALALSSQMAYAVNVSQIPANGYVVAGSASGSTASASVNNVSFASGNVLTITVSGSTVIDWASTSTATIQGTSATINPVVTSMPSGFDIGPNAGVAFTGSSAVLNVDITGNPSVIAGQMSAEGSLFVANANGIVVAGGSQIVAPVMGFINADLSSTQATALFKTSGVIPLNFSGSAGVQIQAGANLASGVTAAPTVIVAGAGLVNVEGASGVTNYIPNSTLIVDGGVGGYISGASGTTPTFNQAESGAATPIAKVSTSNYDASTTYYQDAPASVSLNLGTTNSPFNFATGSELLANGNITLSGAIASAQNASMVWNGTLTNTGVLNANTQTNAVLATGAGSLTFNELNGAVAPIYNNQASTSMVPLGGLVNNGTLAGFSSFAGASFNNQGNLVLTGTGPQGLTIDAYTAASAGGFVPTATGTVTLGGTITALQSGATIGSVAISGGTVNINTTMANVNGGFAVTAGTLNITQTVSTVSGNDFEFDANTNGVFNLASTGSISADNVYLASGAGLVNGVPSVLTNFIVNGGISATSDGGTVEIGGGNNTSAGYVAGLSAAYGEQIGNMVSNVSGAGSITADNVVFNSLLGSVNNITTTNMFQNGFAINNPTSGGVTNITFNAINGLTTNQQGVNLKVNGNATLSSGVTDVVAPGAGSVAGGFVSPGSAGGNFTPNNANSRLVVQATGTLGTGGINFPGLVYLSAAKSITVNGVIDNAYAVNSPAGYGIWLASPNTTAYNGFLTVGNRAVNFVSPNANANSAVLGGWGSAAQIVNGLDLTTASAAQVSSLAQTMMGQQILRLELTPNLYIQQVPGYVSFNGNTLAQ